MKALTPQEETILKQLKIDSYNESYHDIFDIITEGFDLQPIYTVKELADLLDTSEYTIRYYDKENMFPFVTRDANNCRRYSKLDAFLGRSINCFRSVGFPVETCRQINILALKGDITIPERAELMRIRKQELTKELEEIKRKLEKLSYKLEYYEDIEHQVLQEIEEGIFIDQSRSSLRNCRLYIQKKFYEAGLVDSIDIDI